jgi:predicted TIM-barrel fold metal-dependent hydrolase
MTASEQAAALTNCHIHTFTVDHVPKRFAGIFGALLRIRPLRLALLALMRAIGRAPRSRLARYAQILEVSHNRTQAQIFRIARGFYPQGTRFVVLPMDMEFMNAGRIEQSLAAQHDELRRLRDEYPELVLPFVAVDPRRPRVVATTIALLEEQGFRGIKLYPPLGYHPNDPALADLYRYAAEHQVPILTHCTRRGVHLRGRPPEGLLRDPESGQPLAAVASDEPIARLADPDNYLPILRRHPKLKLCLAHFGGDEEWRKYLHDPWLAGAAGVDKSWLAKIADLIKSEAYENLYTDISYTVFADEEYVHLLKVLLSDERLRKRVLFGSDFYVVENAPLEERRLAVRIRSVLGEALFDTIARENPERFLCRP